MKSRIIVVWGFVISSSFAYSQVKGVLGFDFFGNGTSSTLKKSSLAPFNFTTNLNLMPGCVWANKVNTCGIIGYQRYGKKDEPFDMKTVVNTVESGIGLEYLNYKSKHRLIPLVGIKYLWFNEQIIDISTKNLLKKSGFGTVHKFYFGYSYKASPKFNFIGQCELMDKTYKSYFKGLEQNDIKVHWTFGFRYLLKK